MILEVMPANSTAVLIDSVLAAKLGGCASKIICSFDVQAVAEASQRTSFQKPTTHSMPSRPCWRKPQQLSWCRLSCSVLRGALLSHPAQSPPLTAPQHSDPTLSHNAQSACILVMLLKKKKMQRMQARRRLSAWHGMVQTSAA